MNRDKEYWREVNPPKQYTEEDLIFEGMRSVASRRLRQAVANGTLVRADTCEVCGKKEKTVAHHWNGYDHPFDVWWVCRRCNANLPHDEQPTLEEARKQRADEERDEWRWAFQDLKDFYRKWYECDICGLDSPRWLMEYWDGIFICQHCSPGIDDPWPA